MNDGIHRSFTIRLEPIQPLEIRLGEIHNEPIHNEPIALDAIPALEIHNEEIRTPRIQRIDVGQ